MLEPPPPLGLAPSPPPMPRFSIAKFLKAKIVCDVNDLIQQNLA